MSSIHESLKNAERFLLHCVGPDALWRDIYIRNYTILVDWITAYTGLALLQAGTRREALQPVAMALATRQHSEPSGWACDDVVVPDVDTTAYVVMFLTAFGFEQHVAKGRAFIRTQQLPDGSFRTYDKMYIAPFVIGGGACDGWCAGTPEITATAVRAICGNQRAIQYLSQCARDDGSWRSYWFNNDIYSTTQVILSLEEIPASRSVVEAARKWLLQAEHNGNPFYEAFALMGLSSGAPRGALERRVRHLVRKQKNDGSWESRPFLRYPSPENLQPWKDPSRIREDSCDENRILTTATCVSALARVACVLEGA